MSLPSTNTLDHIVYLSPPEALEQEIKTWRDLGYSVVPGGTHADGLTENALVAFSDGSYIELISFTHPLSHYPPDSPSRPQRENHPWANKKPGYIDFAFLGNAGKPSIASIINERAAKEGSGLRYLQEVKGGRTRKDGEQLEWLITSPTEATSKDVEGLGDIRGRLPFFCGDLTPRELRVPHEKADVTHPNSSLGIAYVRVLVPEDNISNLSSQFTIVIGSSPSSDSHSQLVANTTTWKLQSPRHGSNSILLILNTPQNEDEKKRVNDVGAGIYEIGILVEDEGQAKVNLTQYAKIVGVLPRT